ncbi:AglZ/HisF2 family acetamidino modification protein [Flammeovirga agarivorans]|uniref:imidazole glycerol-phosphate synthase n=1 Tax=Flammeovirga agarivorans TaxID=2726742 RepID=A0A7X8SHT1_9BACT|nr:AglZ/HisF2 family acetamidino modification protein [Flammeovirga agarivorans]NLR90508.1 imidazole glycerol phosphate synthase subunit HisF [Flammeovirga agarivorans]
MTRKRIIPILLLKNGGLVKTIKYSKPNYIGDPINAVKIFNNKEVDELSILDIEASEKNKEPDYKKIEEIVSEAFMPISYGGGINSLDKAKKVFNCGIEKIVINSASFTKPKIISQIAEIYGEQSVVVSIDIKKSFWSNKYMLRYQNGKKKSKIDIISHLKNIQELGAGEVLLNNIDREGTYQGYDLDLIKKIAENCEVPLVVNGGAKSLEDMCNSIKHGASACGAGSLFVYTSNKKGILINYPQQEELNKIFTYNL